MTELAGMAPTGRRIAGPAADLVELDGDDGLKHTALIFHERYRQHPSLVRAIDLARSFLEFPMVAGLVELSHHIEDEGALVYPTGTAWTLLEVVRTWRDAGQVVGIRGALELLYLGGLILQEAAENGSGLGVWCHGSLSPQRILLQENGQVQIIGYGLPSVELIHWRQDGSKLPHEDAFRYSPPERVTGGTENVDADLFCLALVAYELLTGEPLYDGSVEGLKKQAEGGEAAKRVEKAKDRIPSPIRKLLATALHPDPRGRHENAEVFIEETDRLLSSKGAVGPDLAEVMEKVRGAARRGRALSTGGREATRARGVRVPVPAPNAPSPARPAPEADAQPEGGSRWSRPARGGRAEADEPGEARGRLRDRLRRSKGDEEGGEDARQSLKDRLRRGRSSGDEPADDKKAELKSRLRRSKGDEDDKKPDDAKPDDKKADLKSRLKRSKGDEADKKADAKKAEAADTKKAAPRKAAPKKADAKKADDAKPDDKKADLKSRLKRSKASDKGGDDKAAARDRLKERLRKSRDDG